MAEASEADSAAFAEKLNKGMLTCRGLSHSKVYSYVSVIKGLEGFSARKEFWEQHIRCRNKCGVTWSVIYDPQSGRVVQRRGPVYPEGYLAKGMGRINKDVVRLEALRRNFTEESEK